MPSGSSIKVQYHCRRGRNADCHLDVHVYALAEDFGNSEGLCGNFNGDRNDDLTIRGTNQVDSGDEPILFANSYIM